MKISSTIFNRINEAASAHRGTYKQIYIHPKNTLIRYIQVKMICIYKKV